MNVSLATSPPLSMGARILAFPLLRIILAAFATILPVAIILIGSHAALDKSMRYAWPQLLSTLACVAGYRFYVQRVEKRETIELGLAGAGRELGLGLMIGSGLLLATIAILAVAGAYGVAGVGETSTLISPFVEMTLVATIEEIVFRGILFRIIERSLGSWIALGLSSFIFAAAHLPNDGISALAVLFTLVAGLALGAAYMATRRLWLPIGIHFAWNFVSDAIFSLPTSGHRADGLIQGRMAGANWLTGGAYGVEGSAVALALFTVTAVGLLAIALMRNHVDTPFWRSAVG